MPDDDQFVFSPHGQGAIVEPVYARREVKHIAVSENELRQISTLNALTALFVSLASASASFALGILQVAWMEDGLSPEGTAAAKVVVPVLALLTVGFVIAAGVTWNSRHGQIEVIRAESGQS